MSVVVFYYFSLLPVTRADNRIESQGRPVETFATIAPYIVVAAQDSNETTTIVFSRVFY